MLGEHTRKREREWMLYTTSAPPTTITSTTTTTTSAAAVVVVVVAAATKPTSLYHYTWSSLPYHYLMLLLTFLSTSRVALLSNDAEFKGIIFLFVLESSPLVNFISQSVKSTLTLLVVTPLTTANSPASRPYTAGHASPHTTCLHIVVH